MARRRTVCWDGVRQERKEEPRWPEEGSVVKQHEPRAYQEAVLVWNL